MRSGFLCALNKFRLQFFFDNLVKSPNIWIGSVFPYPCADDIWCILGPLPLVGPAAHRTFFYFESAVVFSEGLVENKRTFTPTSPPRFKPTSNWTCDWSSEKRKPVGRVGSLTACSVLLWRWQGNRWGKCGIWTWWAVFPVLLTTTCSQLDLDVFSLSFSLSPLLGWAIDSHISVKHDGSSQSEIQSYKNEMQNYKRGTDRLFTPRLSITHPKALRVDLNV